MRKNLPEVGDLVVVTIKEVRNFGANVKLDEYPGKEGFIHIAEVATGWVKHIKDYLREGQRTVCKVLNVDTARGYVDLSLKRANEHQRREKISEWKNEQKSQKLFEIVAKALDKTPDECYNEFGMDLEKRFLNLYNAFEDAAASEDWLPDVHEKWKTVFQRIAKENIVVPYVKIGGFIEAYSLSSNGVELIKDSMEAGEKQGAEIQYAGAPRYRITVTDKDYKAAEDSLKRAVQAVTESSKKNGVVVEFVRKP